MISRRIISWMFVFGLITGVRLNIIIKVGDLAEAARPAQLHVTTSDSALPDDPSALLERGKEAFGKRYYEEALSCFQKAVESLQKADRPEEEVNVRLWIVMTLLNLYQDSEALEEAEKTADIARSIGDHYSEGMCLKWKGDSHMNLHELANALETYEEAHNALKTARKKNPEIDAGYEVAAIAGRGTTYARLGQYRNAVESYNEALNIFYDESIEKIWHRKLLMAGILRDYGTALMQLGQNEEALTKSQEALESFRELDDQENRAVVLTTIGGISEELGVQKQNSGYYLKAWGKYQEALTIQKKIGILKDEVTTLNNIGKIWDRWGWDEKKPAFHREALRFYREALEKLQSIDTQTLELEEGRILCNIGEAYLHLSFYEKTSPELEKALNVLEEALSIQERINDRVRIWLTFSHLGWAYEQQGKIQEAIDYSRQTIGIFEKIVQQVGIDEFKISLREQADTTYQRLVLLFMKTGQFAEAFKFSEKARARVFLDQLAKAKIDRTHSKEFLQREQQLQRELAETEPYELSDVKKNLNDMPPNATLLSYFVTPEKTIAFIITENSFKAVELPVRRDTLKAAVRRFHDHLEPDNPHPESLQTLHQHLFAPLESDLSTRLIGIIPHDVLHYIPFAALTDGQHYLCEKYALFSLPSASVLEFVLAKRKTGGQNILAMANNYVNDAKLLHFAVEEVRAIAKQYKETTVLISEENIKEASEANFKELAGKYSILHLSAHGELDTQDPLSSGIYLSSSHREDGEDGEDGKLEVHEVYELSLTHADLVVLSACETNLGQRSRGDDIIGLTRSFIYAGTPSVIATLWKVNDYATKELMVAFYKHLKRKSKAEALRAAQQEIRKKFSHPRYWAGFMLTGDPGE